MEKDLFEIIGRLYAETIGLKQHIINLEGSIREQRIHINGLEVQLAELKGKTKK